MTLVSFRIDSGDPVLEAFTDQTYAWLEEMAADFERQMGTRFEGNGVLFANDVLVAIHHHDASWSRFDVRAFERWIVEHEPAFAQTMPSLLADVMCFTNYLARRGHIDASIAVETERRALDVIHAAPPPSARPSRSERRRDARARRRAHRARRDAARERRRAR